MDCRPPGSSAHGILQASILEWVAISFSRGSSQPRNLTRISCTAGRFFTNWAMREAHILHSFLHKKTWEILKLCKSAHGFIASCFLVDSLAGYGILGWKLFPAKLCRCHSLIFPFSGLLLRKLHLFWLQSLCAFFKAPLSSLVWTLPWCALWCGSVSALREPNSIWKRLTLLQF